MPSSRPLDDGQRDDDYDGYYVAYKPITLSSISFMFIEMKFIHCHFLCDCCNDVHEHIK